MDSRCLCFSFYLDWCVSGCRLIFVLAGVWTTSMRWIRGAIILFAAKRAAVRSQTKPYGDDVDAAALRRRLPVFFPFLPRSPARTDIDLRPGCIWRSHRRVRGEGRLDDKGPDRVTRPKRAASGSGSWGFRLKVSDWVVASHAEACPNGGEIREDDMSGTPADWLDTPTRPRFFPLGCGEVRGSGRPVSKTVFGPASHER